MANTETTLLIDYFVKAATNQRDSEGYTVLDKSKLDNMVGSIEITPAEAFLVLDCGCLQLKVDGTVVTITHHDRIHRGISICNIRVTDIHVGEEDLEEEEDEE